MGKTININAYASNYEVLSREGANIAILTGEYEQASLALERNATRYSMKYYFNSRSSRFDGLCDNIVMMNYQDAFQIRPCETIEEVMEELIIENKRNGVTGFSKLDLETIALGYIYCKRRDYLL